MLFLFPTRYMLYDTVNTVRHDNEDGIFLPLMIHHIAGMVSLVRANPFDNLIFVAVLSLFSYIHFRLCCFAFTVVGPCNGHRWRLRVVDSLS